MPVFAVVRVWFKAGLLFFVVQLAFGEDFASDAKGEDLVAFSGSFDKDRTVVWNKQESRRNYWATRSSIRSFACTAHLFACSSLLDLVRCSTALICLLARSLSYFPAPEAKWMIRCWNNGLFCTIVQSKTAPIVWTLSDLFIVMASASRLKASRLAPQFLYFLMEVFEKNIFRQWANKGPMNNKEKGQGLRNEWKQRMKIRCFSLSLYSWLHNLLIKLKCRLMHTVEA